MPAAHAVLKRLRCRKQVKELTLDRGGDVSRDLVQGPLAIDRYVIRFVSYQAPICLTHFGKEFFAVWLLGTR